MPINLHFDLVAPLYDRLFRPPDPDRLRELLDLPAPGQAPAPGWMLDAGGGTGRVSALFCPLVEKLAIGDLSQPMLRQVAAKAAANQEETPEPHCPLPVQARVECLPYADGSFARILVVDAFHHFGDQPGALHELARVLRPGGRLVIEEPDIRHGGVKLIALGETLMLMGSRFRTPQWVCDQLNALGLRAHVETQDATAWVVAERGA